MKKLDFFPVYLIFLFLTFFSKAQNVDWSTSFYPNCFWNSNQIGVNAVSKAISCDSTGNIYSAKVFRGCLFGTYVAKHSPQGQLLWSHRLDSGYVDVQNLKVDKEGNVYILGTFKTTININGLILNDTLSYGTAFCARLSTNGIAVWAFKLPPRAILRNIEISKNGEIYGIGQVNFINAQFDNYIIPANHNFIAKINPNGSYAWVKAVAQNTYCKSLKKDNLGDYYIAGEVWGYASIGNSNPLYLTGHVPGDIYIAKLDSNFNALWVKLGRSNGGKLNGLELDPTGNAFIAGTLGSYLLFDNNYIQSSGTNMFLIKVNKNGNLLWAKNSNKVNANNIALNECNALTIDNQGNSYIAGGINSDTTNIDGYMITEKYSPYLVKFDSLGNFKWGLSSELEQVAIPNYASNPYEGSGKSICRDNEGNVFIACSSGQGKSFMTKISENITTGIKTIEINNKNDVLNIYPNPTQGIFQIEFVSLIKGILQVNITAANGRIVYSESASKTNNEFKTSINLSRQAKGVYFVEVIAGDTREVKKVVLE